MTLGFARLSVKTIMAALAAIMFLVTPAVALDYHPDTHGVTQNETLDHALHQAVDMTEEVEGLHQDAAAHDEAHGSGGLPQFDVTTFTSQWFWLAVTFAVMYFVFSKRSLPAISGTIENRREHVQNDLETADRMRSEAEEVQHNYENGLQSARAESARLMNDAIGGTKAEAESALSALRARGEAEVAALEGKLQKASAAARAEMDGIAAEIAREAAEKVFGISTDIKKAQNAVQSLNARKAA